MSDDVDANDGDDGAQQRARLSQYDLTPRMEEFEWDFTRGVSAYETWDRIRIGEQAPAQNTFEVTAEDIRAFNRSCLETEPAMFDDEDPVAHPLFPVMITFWCVGTGIGSWIRSPGARNPGQRIEFHDDYRPGDVITATITHHDKWIRRGHHYMEDLVELHDQHGTLKGRWYVRLLLPPDGAAVEAFATA